MPLSRKQIVLMTAVMPLVTATLMGIVIYPVMYALGTHYTCSQMGVGVAVFALVWYISYLMWAYRSWD